VAKFGTRFGFKGSKWQYCCQVFTLEDNTKFL